MISQEANVCRRSCHVNSLTWAISSAVWNAFLTFPCQKLHRRLSESRSSVINSASTSGHAFNLRIRLIADLTSGT